MKSERRHDLQTNTLARGLENLPKVGRESGSKILLAVIAVLLVVVLVRLYSGNRTEKRDAVATQLAAARDEVARLQSARVTRQSPDQVLRDRQDVLNRAENAIDEVLKNATDGPHVAEAKRLRGDLYLALGGFGDAPEPTTRPELALPRKADQFLDDAVKNYNEVLAVADNLPPAEAANARFGLAAAAEDRANWGEARNQYQAINSAAGMPEPFKDLASLRLSLLDKISAPVLLGQPSTQPLVPPPGAVGASTRGAGAASLPSMTPLTTPSTSPATGPTTVPATSPSALPVIPLTPGTAPAAGIGTMPTSLPTP